jgi:hypothetical protein
LVQHFALQQRWHSVEIESPTLTAEAGGNPSWLFKLSAKPHFLLRAAAVDRCAA